MIDSVGIIGECAVFESAVKPAGVKDCKKSQLRDVVERRTKVIDGSDVEADETDGEKESPICREKGKKNKSSDQNAGRNTTADSNPNEHTSYFVVRIFNLTI